MLKLKKFGKGVLNHWKKSVFASAAIAYGISYGYENYQIDSLMKTYCLEAMAYGDVTEPSSAKMKKIIVLLNPVANKRNAKEIFDKYCAPILHCAGLPIDIVKTDSEGHARRYVEELETLPDAILLGGGDGTFSEVVTGLLRRTSNDTCRIGIMPIGRENIIGNSIFKTITTSKLEMVRGLANATIAIVRGKVELKDVMKIEILSEQIIVEPPASIELPSDSQEIQQSTSVEPSPQQQEQPAIDNTLKPVYAVGTFEWGAYRDVFTLRDQYWYVNGLREYVAFIFNAFDGTLTWKCKAHLMYSEPCSGCSNCYAIQRRENPNSQQGLVRNRRWWSRFIPTMRLGTASSVVQQHQVDYSKIINLNCNKMIELNVEPSQIIINTNNMQKNEESTDDNTNDIPKLYVNLDTHEYGSMEFIWNSWKRLNESTEMHQNEKRLIEVRTIELIPELRKKTNDKEKEVFYGIDNEAYEVKPIRISLIPQAISLFC